MRLSIKIITSIITAALLSSCGLAVLDDRNSTSGKDTHSILISGTVSELKSGTPLSGIKVTLEAYGQTARTKPNLTTSVYSNSNGIYEILAEGFTEPIRCTITAASTDLESLPYESASQEINVNWTGTSYDNKKGTFFANDCNFQLTRIK